MRKLSELQTIQQEKLFNEQNLYAHIKKFSFPRLCGTQGETDAVNLVEHTFRQIGFEANKYTSKTLNFPIFIQKTLLNFLLF